MLSQFQPQLQQRALLALHRTLYRSAGLTDTLFRHLLQSLPEIEAVFSLSPTAFQQLGIPATVQQAIAQNDSQVAQDLEQLARCNITLLPLGSPDYPELLSHISDPPPLLYALGDVSLLNQPQLAMVGSRKTTRAGCDHARRFASELASAGLVITSGMALGIDAECHRGALDAAGKTIAVLGTGVDVAYPARHSQLYNQIASHGVVVSEFPLGAAPSRFHFPRRNRIISGMSLGVLVVEAAVRSGSLITARCALEQGREVFAIPGSIQSITYGGCHELIRQGATLVETVADIAEQLQCWITPAAVGDKPGPEPVAISDDEQQLMTLLAHDPAPIDLLHQRSGWPLPQLTSLLTTLELKGLIENQAGVYQRIA